MSEKYTMDDVKALSQKYKNWGKWGTNDQLGTLNYITPGKVVDAAKLVKQGKTFSLAIPFDDKGPQTGAFGRFNPIHFMLQDGGDIIAGAQDHLPNLRYTDDAVTMPLQCATQWDALAHILYEDRMYNGYAASEITSSGARKTALRTQRAKSSRAACCLISLAIARRTGLIQEKRFIRQIWTGPPLWATSASARVILF